MKYFCSKCGKTTQYNFELPKFCSSCGQSFESKSSTIKAEDQRNKFLNELKLKKNINPLKIQDDLEDAEEYYVESNIDFKKIKPSFKVDVYKSRGESFGSLIENPSKPVDMVNNIKNEQKTNEEILAEFQREAGPLRS
jgi:heterodisulfide reductase subunit B